MAFASSKLPATNDDDAAPHSSPGRRGSANKAWGQSARRAAGDTTQLDLRPLMCNPLARGLAAGRRDRGASRLTPGTAVRLRAAIVGKERHHIFQHARHRDVGVIQPSDGKADELGFLLVKFSNCPRLHRIVREEIELLEQA